MQRTLSLVLEREPGALVRIISMITRRRFNIESITFGACESKYYDRMVITIINDNNQEQREGDSVTQLIAQLLRLINVLEVKDITFVSSVQRELLLVKIKANTFEKSEIIEYIKLFKFNIIEISSSTIILEFAENPEKILEFERFLENYEVIQLVRTGKIGLVKDSINIGKKFIKYFF